MYENGWKRVSSAMLAALITLQSLWMIAGVGGETASAATPQREWQTLGSGVVDDARSSALDLALHNDTPYIIYSDLRSGRQIRAKKWESGSWQYAGDNGNAIDLGHTMRFASSQNGTLYAAFLGEGSYKPAVLMLDQNNWTKLGGADLTLNSSKYPDIAVDAGGNVYATFQDGGNENKATLRIHDGTSWTAPEVASGPQGWYPALTMGSDGKPLLFYSDGSNGYYWPIVKRRNGAGSWSTVGEYPFTYFFGFFMEMKTARDGNIYAAYASGNSDQTGETNVWRFDGTAWAPLGSWPSQKNEGPALAIDPTDQMPVIAYLDRPENGYPTSGRAHVKKWNGSAWEELGQAGHLAPLVEQLTLAIGSDGTPYLAYADTQNDYKPTVLAYLPDTAPPVLATQTPAPGATDVATNAGLALTFNEDVKAAAGKFIEICPENSACEQVDAGSDQVTVAGNVATVAPSAEWKNETDYTVHIEAGAFADLNGNPSSEVANWTFTTAADTTSPRIANAIVNRDTLTFEFTESLIKPEGRYFGNDDFDVRANGSSVQLNMVAGIENTNQVLVVLTQPAAKTDMVTVAYVGGSDITDTAGNAVDTNPVTVTNLTPGAFQTPPQLQVNMKAGYLLKAGDAIVRFVPSISGAVHIQFKLPNAESNPPTLHTGSIVKSDFVIKDTGNGTEIAPRAVSVNSDPDSGIYEVYLALPVGVSLTQGNTYELAMSASAGRDEIAMPANPTTSATAYLALWNLDVLDEYRFENLTIGEKEPVDLMALEEAIATAQAKHDVAVEGEANGNYEAGSKAALQGAIDAAIAVRNNAASTQEEVDAAVAALGNAVTAFDAKRVGVNLTALTSAIDAAQAKHDVAVEGGANGNYEAGSKAVLQAAIDAAIAVRNNAASTQEEVDAAVAALGNAVTAFDAKRVGVNLTALTSAIDAAQAKHDVAVEGGANGNYEAGSKAVLQAAIDAAIAVRNNAASTQAQVDAAVSALDAAVTAFDAKRVGVNLTALTSAIDAAQAKHDAAVEGEANGNYEAGSKAVLQAAIDAGIAVRNNAASTQEEVDAAVAALGNAVTVFDAKQVVVNLTALTSAIDAAQAKHDVAVEGSANGNYETGSKVALQAAIDAAKAIRDNAASTQAQVDAAVTTLNAVITVFDTKKIVKNETPGGGTPGGGTPGGGASGGGGTPGGGGSVQTAYTTYTLDVSFGGGKVGILSIKRTTDSDGRVKDTLELSETIVEQAVNKLKESGMDRLVIALPASQTTAHDFSIALPSKAATRLTSGGISLVIRTPEAGVSIPPSSFQRVDEALTFTISPVRNSADRSSIEQHAKGSTVIRTKAGVGEVTVIGQPVEIETNLQQREVTLTLPFTGDFASKDVGVYIEHSDGTRELVRGRLVESNDVSKTRSLEFEVNKFSTFAIINVAGWSEHEKSQVAQLLDVPYMSGYAGGVFKPNASLTRAEMATMLARVIGGETGRRGISFSDVPTTYWASEAIEKIVALGIMSGYPEGAFRPEQPITRAEMATILSLLPIKADHGAEGTRDFSDTVGHWAQAAIRKARAVGLLSGYEDGTFRPEQALSRAEAVVILNKLIGRRTSGNDEPLFADVPRTHWAFEAIQAATRR